MCRLLEVPRSTFYAWRALTETPTAARRRQLAVHVRRVFDRGRSVYGCRRVAAQLNREGHECSVGLVVELMRQLGLRAVQPRAYKRTTISARTTVATPDLIGRDFTATAPGRRLVGDITYLKTGEGWLYLATVIDLASRRVVGWAMADNMETDLVADALRMAISVRAPAPGLVFHSDRGSQYTSEQFRRLLADHHIVQSLSRRGQCWDNAVAESWFATYKAELIDRGVWPNLARLRTATFDYIEVFYNRRRRHSALGQLSPARYELNHKHPATQAA